MCVCVCGCACVRVFERVRAFVCARMCVHVVCVGGFMWVGVHVCACACAVGGACVWGGVGGCVCNLTAAKENPVDCV